MTSLIKVPFASSGDKTAVPDTDAGGSVNMTQGYGQAYSLDPATDPSAKRIEREKMNWLFNLITSALKEIQAGGITPFITSADNGGVPYSYGKGATIILGGVVYQSLADSNTTTPPGAQWSEVKNSSNGLTRQNPFGDIKADGSTAVATALSNLGLIDANGYSGRKIGEQWITTSSTYAPTAGTKRIKVTITGGGGGGGGAFNGGAAGDNFSGAGGASGSTGIKWFNIADITNFAVVIGAGGTEATKGGNSTFSGMVATGGNPSTASTVYASGGVGVVGSGGDVNLAGGDGGDGQNNTRFLNGYGGSSFWGGSRRAGQCTVSSPRIAKALVPGGGGAGAYDTQVFSTRFYGGEGADGICLVEEFA